MAKKITFKNPDSIIVVPGYAKKITPDNITEEDYNYLLKQNEEAYKAMFNVSDASEEKSVLKSTKSKDNATNV